MAILIKINGEITNVYPNNRKHFTSREVANLFFGVQKGNVETIELAGGEKPTLKVWCDGDAELKKLGLNKDASAIGVLYNGKSLRGDVLVEGDVQLVLDEIKLNTEKLNFSPIKSGNK